MEQRGSGAAPDNAIWGEGIWYCGLTEEAIDRIANEHFVGGRVIEEYARGRHERPERG